MTSVSGIFSVHSSRDEVYRSLENLDIAWNVTTRELAHIINEAFLSPMRSFSSLPEDILNRTNTICAEPAFTFTVTTQSVLMKLSKLNPTKANGPDGIPGWLLKENADLFADPIKEILNSSYREGHLPQSWKFADIVPIPKQKPVKNVNKHLRPIFH